MLPPLKSNRHALNDSGCYGGYYGDDGGGGGCDDRRRTDCPRKCSLHSFRYRHAKSVLPSGCCRYENRGGDGESEKSGKIRRPSLLCA